MTRPAIEVADIVRRRGSQFIERFKAVLNYQQLKAYRAVKRCRTAALGGHRDKCEDCTYEAPFSYNSCLMGSNSKWGVMPANSQILNIPIKTVAFSSPLQWGPKLALWSNSGTHR
jgi:hypothetical protein